MHVIFLYRKDDDMSMKYIVNYIEFGGNEGSLVDNCKALNKADKEKVLKYLKKAPITDRRCSSVMDYIKKQSTTIGDNLRDDGEYVWAEEEIYHFEHYDIELDEDFVRKVLNNK